MPIHIFVGPTLGAAEVSAIAPGAFQHPPVVHGDLLRLPLSAGDVVAIIDGSFHHAAPVRHKEILAVLASGVPVVGCSSMGALRAAELQPFGMIGHGEVFTMYRDGIIDADDEVAVAHTEAPEYRKLSVSLVTFRYAAHRAVQVGVIDRTAAQAIVAAAKNLPYTSRSWRTVEAAIHREDRELAAMVPRLHAFAAEHPDCRDIKAHDAVDTLARVAELAARAPDTPGAWAASEDWRKRYLYQWQAEFTGTWVDGVHASLADVLRYEQLYDGEFPHRWRRFVLERIQRATRSREIPAGEDPLTGALATAAIWGLTPGSLTPAQTAEWLTAREEALPAEERLVLVLIRSFRRSCLIHELTAADANLLVDGAARAAVAESHVVNERIASWGPGQSAVRIKPARLRQHLADSWTVPPDDERGMRAAARDRGFACLDDAIEAARPFLLRQHLRAEEPTLPLVNA